MKNVSSSNGNEKYPKLRFPEFRDEWTEFPFEKLVDEFNDRTKEENEDTLLSAAIEGMFLNSELFDHQRGASNKGYKKIKKGTMVLSTQNLHLGNANVNQRFEHGMVSPAYKTYAIKNCSIDLMAQWIKSEKAKKFFFNATTVGASVCRRNVEWETLYKQKIYLPSMEEQNKIAYFLKMLTLKIEKQSNYVTLLKNYKRGVLTAAFESCNDSSSFETTPYYFSELATKRKEKYDPHSGKQFPCVELEHIEQETGRVIGNVQSTQQNSIKNICKAGDTLFGKLRPYLRKYTYVKEDMVCSSEIWPLVPSEKLIPEYLFYLVQTDEFLRIANISSGTKMPRAEWANIEKAVFLIPSKEKQSQIVQLLRNLDRRILDKVAMLENIQMMKKGLLQQLFI